MNATLPNTRDGAACRDQDPELFFPVGNSGPALAQIDEAKTVCTDCPLLSACAEFALTHPSMTAFGVWGGMSENERRNIRRREQRQRAAALRTSSANQPSPASGQDNIAEVA
jgi:WhiB family transcriptional regulator, redox-sensing transcriptional regulator